MQNPNYTLFGLNDGGQDPQAVLTYKGGVVLPEITVTPTENYIFNPYDNIILHQKAEGGGIHIKPENRGKFTALKERTGHSATWFKEHGTPEQKKMATFALNARKWKHGDGGHLFDGLTEDSQQMQIGREYWQQQASQPTLEERLAEFNRQKEIERQQKIAALREQVATKGRAIAEQRLKDSQVEPNDNAWVDYSLTVKKPKNPHLHDRAVEGAKAHAAWEKEHPNLTAWGNVLGAAPFAVAAYPLASTIGSGVAALGDAAAATTAGQGLTNFLVPVATSTIAGAPVMEWANAGLTSMFGAHGIQSAIDEGGISPMTALEMIPLTRPVIAVGRTGMTKITPMVESLFDEYPALYQYPRYAVGKFKYGFDAELPTLYRKVKTLPKVENGRLQVTNPNNRFAYNNGYGAESPIITNFTTDAPVRSHSAGNWDRGLTLAFPGKTLLGRHVISTRPSDTFVFGDNITIPIKDVIGFSGRSKELNYLGNNGIEAVSSPEAEVFWNSGAKDLSNKIQKYRKVLPEIRNRKGIYLDKDEPVENFLNYSKTIEGLTRETFKSPTPIDYQFMDYVFRPKFKSDIVSVPAKIDFDLVDSNPETFGAWAGDWSRRRYLEDSDNWREVMYDPHTGVEADFRRRLGIDLKPQYKKRKTLRK